MHDLNLKTVRDLERSFELGQAPIDEVRKTSILWVLAEKNGELRCDDGVLDAATALLERVKR